MSDLDQIDWESLQDAYGNATEVPALLRRAETAPSDFADEWNDLWSHLCHQGTVYTASYAALPSLASMCRRREPRGFLAPLQLAGAIIASNDAPEGADLLRDACAAESAQLQVIAERSVGLATDDSEFVYGLETLAAFEDRGVWSRNLSHLADGEVPLECDSCGDNLLVHIEELPATVTVWDATRDPTTVEPKQHLAAYEERLVALAHENGRPQVAEKLRHLFGTFPCPGCQAELSVTRLLA